uniref:G-patch domain-containing protein n=1 Tax=Salix viminalis TaxID=40686 RepID=A0A6N2KZG7_SALVM
MLGGGLYGDLPPPSAPAEEDKSTSTTSSVWSSSTLMAPPTLRKPMPPPPPQTILKSQNKPKPSKTLFSPAPPVTVLPDEVAAQPALVGVNSVVTEEYDPARPNDYEDYRREKKRKAMEAERLREIERRRQEEEERESREKEDRERDTNISGEEAWKRRAAMSGGGVPRSPSPPSNGDGFRIGKSETVGLGVGAGGQMTAAQRMMAKMGWKEGQGLGKQEQGITTPLVAKKTDRRAGVIVNASESKPEKKVKSVNFNGTPTRVLLLRNMAQAGAFFTAPNVVYCYEGKMLRCQELIKVGPGEVDDDLEDEVGSECSKYGTVTRVLIFEITEPNFPREEAVRIFIQFERPEETTKALIDLDGRFFGGNVVRATFYDEEKFSKNELAPMPDEIPGF